MPSDPAIADITSEQFLRNFSDSGLSGVDEARAAASDLAPATASRIANRLVDDGVLTSFQAGVLLTGKASDLRMGNYDILDKLGEGGMGAVYKARHRRMKRVVALKVLSKAIAQSALFAQRFQREVETIAKLQHPNIVMAFDADEAEVGPFLIMEFVDGRDLAGEVDDTGPLSVSDAVDCILQSARGLECAHQQGIVHRDIKPSNLMRDRSGAVKVTDLGLARLNGPDNESSGNFSLTQAGSVLGTVDYMAPEQALDSTAVDARADIYSLGGTLYFLLAGQPPYQAGSIMAMLLKHREAPIPSLRATRSDVPIALDAIYQRMMAKSPESRQASLTEVIAQLEELARTEKLSDAKPQSGPAMPGAAAASNQTAVFEPAAETQVTAIQGAASSATIAGPIVDQSPVVVLVEPSRTQAGIFRNLLEQLGITSVHAARSGKESLELARRERANVVISSMHLSDMTGVQLAQTLLADADYTGVGFILATSESDSQAALPANTKIAKLVKPFDVQKLRRSLEAALPSAVFK